MSFRPMPGNPMHMEHTPSMPPELWEAMKGRVAQAEGILATVKRLEASEWLRTTTMRTARANLAIDLLIRKAERIISEALDASYRNLPFLEKKLERFKNLTWGQVHYYSMDSLIHEWSRAFDEAIRGVYIPDLPRLSALRAEIESLVATPGAGVQS